MNNTLNKFELLRIHFMLYQPRLGLLCNILPIKEDNAINAIKIKNYIIFYNHNYINNISFNDILLQLSYQLIQFYFDTTEQYAKEFILFQYSINYSMSNKLNIPLQAINYIQAQILYKQLLQRLNKLSEDKQRILSLVLNQFNLYNFELNNDIYIKQYIQQIYQKLKNKNTIIFNKSFISNRCKLIFNNKKINNIDQLIDLYYLYINNFSDQTIFWSYLKTNIVKLKNIYNTFLQIYPLIYKTFYIVQKNGIFDNNISFNDQKIQNILSQYFIEFENSFYEQHLINIG